jgi:endo-1,3-1,4-beta-glycanase ExoK
MKTNKLTLLSMVLFFSFCSTVSANTYVNQTTHTINWDGIRWIAATGHHAPLNNNWSDSPSNLWIDNLNRLHLTIKNDNGKWDCTQLSSENSYTYGIFTWKVVSPVFTFDKNSVLGLFTYADDNHELDIEASRRVAGNGDLIRFTVQPYWPNGNTKTYLPSKTVEGITTDLAGFDGHNSTFQIDWEPTYVDFTIWDNYGNMIANMHYVNSTYIPIGPQKLYMNFYLAAPPSNGKNLEVVIASVGTKTDAKSDQKKYYSKDRRYKKDPTENKCSLTRLGFRFRCKKS